MEEIKEIDIRTSDDSDDDEYNNQEDLNDEVNIQNVDLTTYFTAKELCYYKMIDRFFKSCPSEQIQKMLNIVNSKSEISLRVLDWFVTRYSKENPNIDEKLEGENFDVHISYKSQLKSYRKKYFDPFRRRKKFNYNYDKNDPQKTFYTTLGQLNFFQWAIQNRIIEFVEKHSDNILKAMNIANKEDNKKKKTTKKNKIKDNKDNKLIIKAEQKVSDDNVEILLSFE